MSRSNIRTYNLSVAREGCHAICSLRIAVPAGAIIGLGHGRQTRPKQKQKQLLITESSSSFSQPCVIALVVPRADAPGVTTHAQVKTVLGRADGRSERSAHCTRDDSIDSTLARRIFHQAQPSQPIARRLLHVGNPSTLASGILFVHCLASISKVVTMARASSARACAGPASICLAQHASK